MCGIVGFLTNGPTDFPDHQVLKMTESLRHRGPDEAGVWVDAQAGIGLGHRRLAILDLSPAGSQPMHSASGRYVIAFNGEIYNHLELRSELGAISFRGRSDTETLLAGFQVWGIEETLRKSVGMFAIAMWDSQTQTLHLARDRFGEKPLYYGWVGSGARAAFVFGSELKALRAYSGFSNTVSREVLGLYMRFAYVPAPHSIYQSIFKLEPGCLLSINGSVSVAPSAPLRPPATLDGLSLRRWWSLAKAVSAGAGSVIADQATAIQMLDQSLNDAVRLQSQADVPLGAFLSGGVDSSTVVALMQKQSMKAIKTFTVGFEEARFDESPYARAVSQHLGTEHTEAFVTAAEAQDVIPNLPDMYDEPFADASQIPTHLVCKVAGQQVKVALSGDAGDELFGGYQHYFRGARIWANMSRLSFGSRKALGLAVGAIPLNAWDAMEMMIGALLPKHMHVGRLAGKAHWVADRLRGDVDLGGLHKSMVSKWKTPAKVVKGTNGMLVEPSSLFDDPLPKHDLLHSELEMMYRDSITYLADDILCKVDRAAMAVSLETRVPFLDHRVTELAWRMPLCMKIRGTEGKWALRQVLYKYVPPELIDRPKAGFSVPVGQWLRGPLREWAEGLLCAQRLEVEGYFHSVPIRTKWVEHLSGQFDHTDTLWTVLMFQAWLENEVCTNDSNRDASHGV